MFEADPAPRLFAVPPGVDFPRALIDGLLARLDGAPPEALARVVLIVNTQRMARRLRTLFDAGPARLLPRLCDVTDPESVFGATGLPSARPPLQRRLELAQLIAGLLEAQPDLAAQSSRFDLADSLAALMDEMHGEGVRAEAIRALDVSDLSGHWERVQAFFDIAERFTGAGADTPDPAARQRQVVETLICRWQDDPPAHPVILAGSTGSRGTTQLLMQAVARLPQGAIVLPGFDFEMPNEVWDGMGDAMLAEDHPQYRFRALSGALDLAPRDIRRWHDTAPPSADRNRLVSLALRPAPVTDAWLSEGPRLDGIDAATAGLTLLEAPNPRAEALAIAARLREAAETGRRAALITPDRMLTRQVAAALDRWRIEPDDSAGLPLQLSPPGRFLRQVADLFRHRLTADRLLALLKHPLCHSGAERGDHLRHTRDLELYLRRQGVPYPDADSLRAFAAKYPDAVPSAWIGWLTGCLCDRADDGTHPLLAWTERLCSVAEAAAGGSAEDGSGGLWDRNAGQAARAVLDELEAAAGHGGDMRAGDFADLLGNLLSGGEVRDRDAPHPDIMIWGTMEARVMGADLLILGGLNEGSWPEAPPPDPWLNRAMRHRAGLLLPERRIGLSAHDFEQAVAAPEVWLTRAKRSEDAETVPSRWLNRLTNLLDGLPDAGGRAALTAMRDRGAIWLRHADRLDAAPRIDAALRPAPRPPVAARPRRLSVTEIKTLIRDPYAIYARHVLKLKPLDPLTDAPDARLRGIVVHDVLDRFVRATLDDPALLSRDIFLRMCHEGLEQNVPWAATRRLWLARLERIADDFVRDEIGRQAIARPTGFETDGRLELSAPTFTLTGRADRIDRDDRGALWIYDYKTGQVPTDKQQAQFDKQLLLSALIAEEGGFEGFAPGHVAGASFVGLSGRGAIRSAPLDDEPVAEIRADFTGLIARYLDPEQGFTSRRMLFSDKDRGNYDHLARFGEWDRAVDATPEDLA